MVTIDKIKELREATGVSVMQCKKALEEAEGDSEKALVILRKKSGEIAAKKSDRILSSGTVASYIHVGGTVGAMVMLSSETDFVSSNEDFKMFARELAMHITATNPLFIRREDVPEEEREKARAVFLKEAMEKPEAVREKIVAGKLDAYFGERVLYDQSYIKKPEITIRSILEEAIQKFGEKIEVTRFVRFSV